ncbi:hypothetical protein GCM10007049_18670 [Echinicola pacifica]|uniref:Tetratricopeptide repeat-containing protein n=1 Tax=Echinicola pacifica TaxID=346377 RepID=A0A918PZL0_9BACT|nr:hypothetical protein [Echinicola pacifica]GGZ26265.1 hypothetical protein GCM10007049_18670 [Echinicola pacifica]
MRKLFLVVLVLSLSSCGHSLQEAERHFAQGQYYKTISELNWVLFMKMSNTEALQLRAMAYEQLKDWNNALMDYKLILQMKPEDGIAYAGIGKVYWEQGSYILAEKNLLLAARYRDDDAELMILLGRAMIKNKNFQSADLFLLKATELEPKLAKAYFYRGIVQAHLGDAMGSASQFNMYLMYAEDNIKAYYNRGFAMLSMGMTDWAREDFEFVLKHNPKHHEALARHAVCIMSSNPGKACADLQLAANKGSEFAKEHLKLCR